MELIDKEQLKGRFQAECERLKCNRWDISAILDEIDDAPVIVPPPNPPLTLEELREMDGEPVWVVPLILTSSDVPEDADIEEIEKAMEPCWVIRRHWKDTNHEYGITWIAYRRKPEEETI